MKQRKDFFIYSSALPLAPPSNLWIAQGIVFKQDSAGSAIEVTRLQDMGIAFDMKEMAEWYGCELCRIVIDEFLA